MRIRLCYEMEVEHTTRQTNPKKQNLSLSQLNGASLLDKIRLLSTTESDAMHRFDNGISSVSFSFVKYS